MNTLNYKDEFNQLNKIIKSYNLNSLKDTLLFANNSKFKFPNLNNIPQYHNIVGLINFRLNDLENSIQDFEKAINLDPNFYSAFYNLGLLFFKTKDLKKSYSLLNQAIIIKNDYKLARDKIIEILSFYEPDDKNSNFICDIDRKVKQVPYEIDFSKEITDQQIVLTKNSSTVGIGSGQPSRLDSCKIAIEKMNRFQKINEKDIIIGASDAFFPFVDGIETLVQNGVSAIIQPAGSIRDKEIIKFADKLGIILVFSKTRHFKH